MSEMCRNKPEELAKKIQLLESFVLCIEHDRKLIPVVKISSDYAAKALHNLPPEFRSLGVTVTMRDVYNNVHQTVVHGIHWISDFVVFKKTEGEFVAVPELQHPSVLAKYICLGFAFGEKQASYRVGRVSSISNGTNGFFYGDSGGLPGFSGGAVFNSLNCGLMGIGRGNQYEDIPTHNYEDILQVVSSQYILYTVYNFQNNPFVVQ